jgi:GTPase
MQAWWQERCRCDHVLRASALKKRGMGAVRRWMVQALPEGPTLYPKEQVSEQPEKFFVAEILRERLFELYGQEIPYATQVLP